MPVKKTTDLVTRSVLRLLPWQNLDFGWSPEKFKGGGQRDLSPVPQSRPLSQV